LRMKIIAFLHRITAFRLTPYPSPIFIGPLTLLPAMVPARVVISVG